MCKESIVITQEKKLYEETKMLNLLDYLNILKKLKQRIKHCVTRQIILIETEVIKMYKVGILELTHVLNGKKNHWRAQQKV